MLNTLFFSSRALLPWQREIAERSMRAGLEKARFRKQRDGGLLLGGDLDGHQIAVIFPHHWNRQSLLFAHGYTLPGSSVKVARNPLKIPERPGAFFRAMDDGLAIGHSAYEKAGVGTKSGFENTLRLKRFLDQLGNERCYLSGWSMGANIVLALIERHPDEFAGAFSACGQVGSWQEAVGAVTDMRALYNYFTKGTPYALPGNPSISRSALSPIPPRWLAFATPLWHFRQIRRIAAPVVRLFKAAEAAPDGPESAIILNIVAAAGSYIAEPGSFIWAMATSSLGRDDLVETFGGSIYGNRDKIYHSCHLDAAGNAALNRDIERCDADPAACEEAGRWYTPHGRSPVKLLSIDNDLDPAIPPRARYQLAEKFGRMGNADNLLQFTVPAVRERLLGLGTEGCIHCAFVARQTAAAWAALRQWVESGEKPPVMPTYDATPIRSMAGAQEPMI